MKQWTLLLALVTAAALSGCVAPDTAIITVDFAGQRGAEPQVFTDELGFYDQDRPTQRFYDEASADHPGYYSAFDLVVEWADDEGLDIQATHDEQFGFFLASIDGLPAPGSSQFWALEVNGEASTVGMEQVEVQDDDTITWTLTDWES